MSTAGRGSLRPYGARRDPVDRSGLLQRRPAPATVVPDARTAKQDLRKVMIDRYVDRFMSSTV